MVVLQAGANTEVRQSATSEKAALRRALQACACLGGPTRLVPALRMAESLGAGSTQRRDSPVQLTAPFLSSMSSRQKRCR